MLVRGVRGVRGVCGVCGVRGVRGVFRAWAGRLCCRRGLLLLPMVHRVVVFRARTFPLSLYRPLMFIGADRYEQ